jgi:hypothetical protein
VLRNQEHFSLSQHNLIGKRIHSVYNSYASALNQSHYQAKLLQPYIINLLKPSGNFTYHQVQHSQILRYAHTMYLCVHVDVRTNSDFCLIQL